MTDPKQDNREALAGASHSAAQVASRAAGILDSSAPKAQSDGFYRDDDGVRRAIHAGDPIPPGVELEGTKSTNAAPEDKSRRAAEKK